MHRYRSAALIVAGMALAQPAAAAAIGANFTFADGSPGFSLVNPPDPDHAVGFLNPGVLVGFNPQPDPPGTPPTFLSLDTPTAPVLSNAFEGPGPVTYRVWLAFKGIGSPTLPDIDLYPPGPCRADIDCLAGGPVTTSLSFSTVVGDTRHDFDVELGFAGGGGFDGSWVSFNPQPDPPGDGWFVDIGFNGLSDPQMFFTVNEDGIPLAFATPEPAGLLVLGVGLIGLVLGRRGRARPGEVTASV